MPLMAKPEVIKKEVLTYFQENPDSKYSIENLNAKLHLTNAADFRQLVQVLAQLENEKLITSNAQGNFGLAKHHKLMEGIFHANDRGFGFVSVDPDTLDTFIAPDNTGFALNGDKVNIEILKEATPWNDKGPEGKVVGILEHANQTLVGEFFAYSEAEIKESGYYGYVQVSDKKIAKYPIFVQQTGLKAEAGDMVRVEITSYPDADHPQQMIGIIDKVLGNKADPGVDVLSIVYSHGVKTEFPSDVIEQAESIPDHISDSDRKNRRDLTDQTIITIDGDDSKDFDDAVTVWKLPNGHYHLGVHIADVSHYVTEGSPLDREAFERSTSTYLTDRVIPMLPFRLSDGICSLNPDVDRLTLSCEMEIDEKGKVVAHEIFPSVIRSKARMTYNNVNKILMDKDADLRRDYEDLVPMLEAMGELHEILYNRRHERGAIDFEEPEAKIIVDDKGKPIDIELHSRGVSEKMIESFMLAANETVAEHYYKKHVPFLYRVHETPDAEKMHSFFEFVTNFGVVIKGSSKNVKPKMLQDVLKQVADKPEEPVITIMLLRSMQQAHYADEQLGHFGLAAEYYTHFTSPIRRYPDLIVHRMIHYYEANGFGEEQKAKWAEQLPEIAEQTSKQERVSIDTERDTDDLKKAEFMEDKVGQEFDAVVSSVLKFGMFVSLPNTVEGLIHISQMNDDYYDYIESQMALVGSHTRHTYRIGQPIKVKLMRVDVAQHEIDFEMVPDENTPTSDLGKLVKRQPRKTFDHKKPSNGKGPNRSRNNSNNNRNGQNNHRNGQNNHKPSTGNRPRKKPTNK